MQLLKPRPIRTLGVPSQLSRAQASAWAAPPPGKPLLTTRLTPQAVTLRSRRCAGSSLSASVQQQVTRSSPQCCSKKASWLQVASRGREDPAAAAPAQTTQTHLYSPLPTPAWRSVGRQGSRASRPGRTRPGTRGIHVYSGLQRQGCSWEKSSRSWGEQLTLLMEVMVRGRSHGNPSKGQS